MTLNLIPTLGNQPEDALGFVPQLNENTEVFYVDFYNSLTPAEKHTYTLADEIKMIQETGRGFSGIPTEMIIGEFINDAVQYGKDIWNFWEGVDQNVDNWIDDNIINPPLDWGSKPYKSFK